MRVKHLHKWFLLKNKQKNYFCNEFTYFQVCFICSLFTDLELMLEKVSLSLISDLIYSFTKQCFPEFQGHKTEECNLFLTCLSRQHESKSTT